MFRIQILDDISTVGLDQFPAKLYEVGSGAKDPDAVLVRSIDLHDQRFAGTLKAVGRAGAGTDNIPIEELSARGIPVFNTPGANANAVKDLVLIGLMMAVRNIASALEFTRQLEGTDEQIKEALEAEKNKFRGIELTGRTLGIVGLGAVGGRVANAALAHDMSVLGFDPEITVDGAWKLLPQVQLVHSIDEILSSSDFITLHVPFSTVTKGMIGVAQLKRVKSSVVILNFSREGVVDESALIEALDSSKVHAYVTDFPTRKTVNHLRIVALPHLGASTQESEENCARMVVQQIRDFLEDGNIHNSVNFPEIAKARSTEFRLVVANANVPEMIAQISTVVGRAGVNIRDMNNGSRGDLAYNIFDLDASVSEAVLGEILEIKDVVMVRAIQQGG